jgi:hypothetical protein
MIGRLDVVAVDAFAGIPARAGACDLSDIRKLKTNHFMQGVYFYGSSFRIS